VHAFSEGPIGYYFLGFIVVVLLTSLVMLTGRSTELRSDGRIDNPVSRETIFLVNNLLLTAFMFTVLLGTMFPLVAEALRGVKVSVGAPFFNRMTVPLCATLLFLVGVGPALPWRGAPAEFLKNRMRAPAAGLFISLVLALVAGARSPYAVLGFAFAGWALIANLQEFLIPARARGRSHGENLGTAVIRVISGNTRRYGGYVAHIGVIMLALGVTASSEFRTEKVQTLTPGQSMQIRDYTIRFDKLWGKQEPHRFVIGSDLSVLNKAGNTIGKLDPRMNMYTARNEPVPTPSVRSRPNGDLYVNLTAFEKDGSSATITALVEPLVGWIWVGGFVVAFGALISLMKPRVREARRVVRDEEEEAVVA
jgi:cytochrome c-type biogenesis protein CcmF